MSEFKDKNNRRIELAIDEYENVIEASHEGESIGAIRFNLIEDQSADHLLVTNMYLDKKPGYLRCGIGTAIIKLIKEVYCLPVVFGLADGSVSVDGSHLTGDGPAFAQSFQVNDSIAAEE